MKRKIKAGTTQFSLTVIVYDNTSTNGGGLSGLTHLTSGLILEYRRAGSSSWTQLGVGTGLVSKTLGSYTSGGIVANGARAGRYEIDIPDAALVAGARFVEICLRGAANMHPVDIEIELDAVDYQDSTRFGLGAIPNVAQGNSGALPTGDASGRVTVTQSFPSNFSLLSIDGTGRVTVGSNADKSGYALTQAFPANFASMAIDGIGRVTVGSNADKTGYALTQSFPANFSLLSIDGSGMVTVGSNADKTGYALTQAFPANFASMAIDGIGRVTVGSNADKTGYALTQAFPANFAALQITLAGAIGLVDELGPSALSANSLEDLIAAATWNSLTTATWATNSFGKHLLISDNNNRSVKVIGAGAGHVAADVHAIQPAVIVAGSFAANAIDANALATDAASEIATAVGNLQAIARLDSMIESDGAGQFRFDTVAVSLAAGGGGGAVNISVEDRSITVL